MKKVKAIRDYSEGLYARIHSTLIPIEDDMVVRVTSIDIASIRSISRI